jgi:hypothetical protein
LGGEIRLRAADLGEFYGSAAGAFEIAADRLVQALELYLAEPLSIQNAAREYGWKYEALRQRLARAPELRTNVAGRPRVVRQTMEELVGRGRGPLTARAWGREPGTLDV